jgi:hypothetical protein
MVRSTPKKVLALLGISFMFMVGIGGALAVGESTGTITACATAQGTTVQGHDVSLDGRVVASVPPVTVPDETNCVTSTYTISTTTVTITNGTTTIPTTTTTIPTTTTTPQSGTLTWAPPSGWENYTNLTSIVGSGGQFNLNNSIDYKLVGYNGGGLRLNGGRNVVIMGSVFTVNTGWLPGGDNCGLCIGDNGTTTSGRIVHVEGSKFTGSQLGDGMQIFDGNAIVQVENDYDVLTHGSTSGVHGDIIQPWGGVKELRIDGFTGYTTCQGGMWKRDLGSPAYNGPIHLRRVNFRDTSNGSDCGYISWVSGSKNSNIFTDGLNGFWIQQASGRAFGKSIWYDVDDSTASNRPVISSDANGTFATYPNLNGALGTKLWKNWDGTDGGQIRQGVPPQGDFVPAGSVGLGYVSPGYQ